MDAEIITYETAKMNSTEKCKISKIIFGFKDRTNESKYIYERKGVLAPLPHIVITKKTFVIGSKHVRKVKRTIKALGAEVKSWKIKINNSDLKKRSG